MTRFACPTARRRDVIADVLGAALVSLIAGCVYVGLAMLVRWP